jgi:hypothetical protein
MSLIVFLNQTVDLLDNVILVSDLLLFDSLIFVKLPLEQTKITILASRNTYD